MPRGALRWRFSRSSGPGGQHVNTSDTKVELICNIDELDSDPDIEMRLASQLGSEVRITCSTERSQLANRRKAIEILAGKLDRANRQAKPRRPTKPSAAARRTRLEDKSRLSSLKTQRRWQPDE